MVDRSIPHFHNDLGVPSIKVSVKEFMCTGASPPFRPSSHFHRHGLGRRGDLLLLFDQIRLRQRSQWALLADRVRIARRRVTLAAARDHRRCRNRRTDRGNSADTGGLQCRDIRESEHARGIGAGLQLTPNATRILVRLGVLERVLPICLKAPRCSRVAGFGRHRTYANATGRCRTSLGRCIFGHSSRRFAARAARRRSLATRASN